MDDDLGAAETGLSKGSSAFHKVSCAWQSTPEGWILMAEDHRLIFMMVARKRHCDIYKGDPGV